MATNIKTWTIPSLIKTTDFPEGRIRYEKKDEDDKIQRRSYW